MPAGVDVAPELEARRTVGRAVFREAQGAGEIRADLDIEMAIDLVYGAVYFRLPAGHQPLSDTFVADLVDYAVRGLSPRLAGV